VDAIVGGWSANWIVSAQTGTPTGLNTGYYYDCNHSYTPDGGPKLNSYLYNNYSSGNPLGCYSTIPQYGLATLPDRIATVRNPSIVNLDFGLHKDFRDHREVPAAIPRGSVEPDKYCAVPGTGQQPGDGPPKLQSNGTYTGLGTVNLYQQNVPRVIQLSLKLLFRDKEKRALLSLPACARRLPSLQRSGPVGFPGDSLPFEGRGWRAVSRAFE